MDKEPKIKQPKVTFKKDAHPTGLSGVGYGYSADIKVDKKICGHISGGHWYSKDKVNIQISVKTENEVGRVWTWIFLKNEAKSLEDAKNLVIAKMPLILKKYTLHFFETN